MTVARCAPAANISRGDRRWHHARGGGSPRREGLIPADEREAKSSLASLRDQRRRLLRGFLNNAAENRVADSMIQVMRIKTSDNRQPVRYLSGGNQQKVVLGKRLCLEPKLPAR